MIHKGVKIAYLAVYEGTSKERKERIGLSYDYLIKLRESQKERMEHEYIGQKQKEQRARLRKEFLLENMINQRWLMSLQATYLGITVPSNYPVYRGKQNNFLDISTPANYSTKETKAYYLKRLIK